MDSKDGNVVGYMTQAVVRHYGTIVEDKFLNIAHYVQNRLVTILEKSRLEGVRNRKQERALSK